MRYLINLLFQIFFCTVKERLKNWRRYSETLDVDHHARWNDKTLEFITRLVSKHSCTHLRVLMVLIGG